MQLIYQLERFLSFIGEIDYGTDVWMYLPHYSEVHPILVTIESDASDEHFLMPRRRYSLKNEADKLEGFKGVCQYLNGGCDVAFASQDCWDNEKECQDYIDGILEEKEKNNQRLRKRYRHIAEEQAHFHCLKFEGEEYKNYLDGFVDCAMYMRENKHLLDINPTHVLTGVMEYLDKEK